MSMRIPTYPTTPLSADFIENLATMMTSSSYYFGLVDNQQNEVSNTEYHRMPCGGWSYSYDSSFSAYHVYNNSSITFPQAVTAYNNGNHIEYVVICSSSTPSLSVLVYNNVSYTVDQTMLVAIPLQVPRVVLSGDYFVIPKAGVQLEIIWAQ